MPHTCSIAVTQSTAFSVYVLFFHRRKSFKTCAITVFSLEYFIRLKVVSGVVLAKEDHGLFEGLIARLQRKHIV